MRPNTRWRMGRHVCKNELVTVSVCALSGVDQHVDPAAVDEVESSEVEHDPSRTGALGVAECALQRGGRDEVDLAADGQRHLVGLNSAGDRQVARSQSALGLWADHGRDSKR